MADQQEPKAQNEAPQQSAPQGEAPQTSAQTPPPAENPAEEQQPHVEPQPASQAEPVAQPQPTAQPEGMKMPQVPEFMKQGAEQPQTKPEERIWALLSYIPLVAIISLVMKPDSPFVKLHGRQGLLLFIVFFFTIFFYLIPFVGPLIGGFVHIAAIVVGIFSMYQAFIGNWWKIPVFGDVAEMIPVDALTKVTRTAVMSEKVDEEKRAEEAEQAPVEEPAATPVSEEQSPAPAPEAEKPAEEQPPAETKEPEKPAEGQ